jgi:hypothetical protein
MDYNMADTFLAEFTPSPQDDRILIPSHGLTDGTQIVFKKGVPANTLPNPLIENNTYYTVLARGNDFKVSMTLAGLPVDITNNGIGVNDVWLKDVSTPGQMLKYTGEGDFTKINIRLFGDGVTKDVVISLSKPPFNLNFMGFYPKNAIVSNVSPGYAKTVSINGDQLMIIFEEPPPAIDMPSTIAAAPDDRSNFIVYFVYGTGI